jgi:hypothetical protein
MNKIIEAMAKAHWDYLSDEDRKGGTLNPPAFRDLSKDMRDAQCEAVRAAIKVAIDMMPHTKWCDAVCWVESGSPCDCHVASMKEILEDQE